MDRLTQSVSSLRTILAGKANKILEDDILNALRKTWQFATVESEKSEYAIVYHRLKEEGDRHLFNVAWNKYHADFEEWLQLPVFNAEELHGGFYPRTKDPIWIVNSGRADMKGIAEFVGHFPRPFQFRDIVAMDKDSYYYIGKLWSVTDSPEKGHFVLEEIR